MKELYDDVLKEEPEMYKKHKSGKGYTLDLSEEYQKWEKRLHKSIGWVEPEEHHEVLLEHSKKDKHFGGYKLASSPQNSETHWDVQMGGGAGFTCKSQEHATILALVLQINERLKRIEKKNIK